MQFIMKIAEIWGRNICVQAFLNYVFCALTLFWPIQNDQNRRLENLNWFNLSLGNE